MWAEKTIQDNEGRVDSGHRENERKRINENIHRLSRKQLEDSLYLTTCLRLTVK